MWSSLMKAAWIWCDGNAKDAGLNTCARNLIKLLINMAGMYTFLGRTPESELVLREALQVQSHFVQQNYCL